MCICLCFCTYCDYFCRWRTVVNDVTIENKIGDALVDRIVRAHRDGTKWKACIVIPLLPGFPFPVDHSDASAVSIINFILLYPLFLILSLIASHHIGMSKPNLMSRSEFSLCPNSQGRNWCISLFRTHRFKLLIILSQPNDYIAIFSLRNWGKLSGDVLTTEMVICLTDDFDFTYWIF